MAGPATLVRLVLPTAVHRRSEARAAAEAVLAVDPAARVTPQLDEELALATAGLYYGCVDEMLRGGEATGLDPTRGS